MYIFAEMRAVPQTLQNNFQAEGRASNGILQIQFTKCFQTLSTLQKAVGVDNTDVGKMFFPAPPQGLTASGQTCPAEHKSCSKMGDNTLCFKGVSRKRHYENETRSGESCVETVGLLRPQQGVAFEWSL